MACFFYVYLLIRNNSKFKCLTTKNITNNQPKQKWDILIYKLNNFFSKHEKIRKNMINEIDEKNERIKIILCQWDDERKHELKRPKVFSLGEREGGGGGYGLFGFMLFTMSSPKMFANTTTILSQMLWPKFSPFHLFTWAKVEVLPLSPKTSILKSIQRFSLFPSDC